MEKHIETLHLFPVLDELLSDLLLGLSSEEWHTKAVGHWTVKDVAAHLLDGNLRTISYIRDGHKNPGSSIIRSYQHLVTYLNEINGEWVQASQRLSPRIIRELLDETGPEYYRSLSILDPLQPAIFPVAWAGQESSPNWFHIAREYTEKWHHQQQIREAVNKPGLFRKDLYYPFLCTIMTALPFTYSNVKADAGTVVEVKVTGEGGGSWFIRKEEEWELIAEPATTPDARAIIRENIAWKIFMSPASKKPKEHGIIFEGELTLAKKITEMISVMA